MAYLLCTAFQLGVAKAQLWLTCVDWETASLANVVSREKAVVGLVKQDHVLEVHYTNNHKQ